MMKKKNPKQNKTIPPPRSFSLRTSSSMSFTNHQNDNKTFHKKSFCSAGIFSVVLKGYSQGKIPYMLYEKKKWEKQQI